MAAEGAAMRILAFVLVLMLVPTSVPAENATSCGSLAELQDGWAVSSPEQQGLDPKLICAIGPRFEGWEEADPHGVVVVRHDVLVYERYFTFGDELSPGEVLGEEPRNASTKHDVYSITKSVTALLTGIAFDHGWLKDLDAPVFSFFPQYADLRTPEKDRITLRHLLTMTSGLDWPENKVSYNNPVNISRRMGGSSDPVRFVLPRRRGPYGTTTAAVSSCSVLSWRRPPGGSSTRLQRRPCSTRSGSPIGNREPPLMACNCGRATWRKSGN